MTPYDKGFDEAVAHLTNNVATYPESPYKSSEHDNLWWLQGYEDCILAYRLNHDVAAMSSAEFRGISLFALEDVIRRLLDNKWGKILPDPRK